MQQIILEFFERFRSDMTESIYAIKGIEDYHKLKTLHDYLDFDRETIFKNKKTDSPCGLRNIACYLNVILQVLYHINFLRQKIFANNSSKSKILEELQFLFGRMQLGKLAYADPTDLFEKLKNKHPEVFIEGLQNDFHQICTILLDQLKECFIASQTESNVIQKILFGKLTIKTHHSQGKSLRNTRFNIINLDVSYDNLQNALNHWKNYVIEDYMTENKKTVKASVQTEFIQTPALLTFFINRVYFKDNKLYKDNRQFGFQKFIELEKSCIKGKNSKKSFDNLIQKQEELMDQKNRLILWIQKMQKKNQALKQTLKYLQEKEFVNINDPTISNKYEQSSQIKEFLDEEIKQIQFKIEDSRQQIHQIQDKISKLYQENQTKFYNLWGMMIHQGTDPNYGHYKALFQTEPNQWVQFNDRKVQQISNSKIQDYHKKGQICCLFYKRPELICNDKKVPITGTLKAKVQQIQKKIIFEIDKARVLQNLYQSTESSGYLVEQETRDHKKNQWLYFFKPILHCLQEKYSFVQCQGVLVFENLKDPNNIAKLQNSFLSDRLFQIPELSLQVPIEYYKYSEVFETFFRKQINIQSIGYAFEWLSQNVSIPCKNQTVYRWIQKYLQVIVMKGIFYLCVLYRATPTSFIEAKFTKLFNGLEKIMKKLNLTSNFSLTYIPIKDEIKRLFFQQLNKYIPRINQPLKMLKPSPSPTISRLLSQPSGKLFKNRFQYWINQRKKISQIDESIIKNEIQEQNRYLIEKLDS